MTFATRLMDGSRVVVIITLCVEKGTGDEVHLILSTQALWIRRRTFHTLLHSGFPSPQRCLPYSHQPLLALSRKLNCFKNFSLDKLRYV